MPGQFITRHSIRGMGELYLFHLPLLIFGLWCLLRKNEKRITAILLLWLFLYPTGSMFTIDKRAQATRSFIGVVPFQIISALGFYRLLEILEKWRIIQSTVFAIFIVLCIFSFIRFWVLYHNQYPLYSSDFWGWQYGPKEIMNYFISHKEIYDDLYMSGEFNSGEIFLHFYDPKNECLEKCKIGDFLNQPEIYRPNRRQIFSLNPQYLNKSRFKNKFSIKKIVYYPDGGIAFQIGEIVQ